VDTHIGRIVADLPLVKVLVSAAAALTGVALTFTVNVPPAASPGRVSNNAVPLSAPLALSTPSARDTTPAAQRRPDVVDQRAEHQSVAALTRQSQPVPVGVALDPALTRPQPGDTDATRRARAALAAVDDTYQSANQLYDQASADATAAEEEVVCARHAAAIALDEAQRAHAEFAALITAQYQGGDTPMEAQLLTAGGPQDFLASLDMQRTVAIRDADVLTVARRTPASR
jgi:hypothetical protein